MLLLGDDLEFDWPNDILFLFKKIEVLDSESRLKTRQAQREAARALKQDLIGRHELSQKSESYKTQSSVLCSLTHSGVWVMGVSASPLKYKNLGLDCEAILSVKRALRLASKILHSQEICPPFLNFETWVSLNFCAKEAAFKALPREIQKQVGFKSFIVNFESGGALPFRLQVKIDLDGFSEFFCGRGSVLEGFAWICVYKDL